MQRISCLRYSLYGCICYRTSGGRPSAANWQLAACSNNMVGSNRSKTNRRRDRLPRSAAALARQPKRIQYTGATPQCPAPAQISHVQVRSRLHPGCLAPGSHCVNITFSSLKARVALCGEGSAKWFSYVYVCAVSHRETAANRAFPLLPLCYPVPTNCADAGWCTEERGATTGDAWGDERRRAITYTMCLGTALGLVPTRS